MIRTAIFAVPLVAMSLAFGCSDYRTNEGDTPAEHQQKVERKVEVSHDRDMLIENAKNTLATMQQKTPGMAKFTETCYGYAVFPRISKGAIGIGGARGEGVVYENGKVIGTVTVTQGTIGAQLGGEVFSEVIFFRDKETLNHFRQGDMQLAAQASAVAAASGASTAADWDRGLAVYTMTRTGLMFEAAVGGQKFTFHPLNA